jgi:hypothetical protein
MARSGRSAVSFEGTHLFRLGLRRGLGRVRLRRRSRSRDRAGPRRWASPRPAGETRTPPREPPTREEARRRGGGAMSSRTSSRFARARVRKRERGRPRPRACRDHWIPRARLCTPSDASDAGVTRADGWEAKKSALLAKKPRLGRSRENASQQRSAFSDSVWVAPKRLAGKGVTRTRLSRLRGYSVATPLASAPASPSPPVGERSRWRRPRRCRRRARARRSRRAGAKALFRAPPAPCAPRVRDFIRLDARLISCAARPAAARAPPPASPAPSPSPR